ncbi:MAG TPA: M23 family metallopeptidase [Candidatus Paceibacterota bacterium]
MRHLSIIIFAASILAFTPFIGHAATVTVTPATVLQGDPIMVHVNGATTADISDGAIGSTKLHFFTHDFTPVALYGVDLRQKIGTTTVIVNFADGTRATASFVIQPRTYPREYMAIPTQLGGNSVENQNRIVNILQLENDQLAAIRSDTRKLFFSAEDSDLFAFPLASTTENPLTITNGYGYNRDSGAAVITHKGADFHAIPGTPVYAIADGIVRDARPYTVYGNSIIVDHGLGLLSMYMHLTDMNVSAGQYIQKGQLIGHSGETGYSEGAHLHLTIRINGISIDPIRFFQMFGTR